MQRELPKWHELLSCGHAFFPRVRHCFPSHIWRVKHLAEIKFLEKAVRKRAAMLAYPKHSLQSARSPKTSDICSAKLPARFDARLVCEKGVSHK